MTGNISTLVRKIRAGVEMQLINNLIPILMKNISFEIATVKSIEQCRDLFDELMAFQKSKANIAQNSFDMMDFDTRVKASYENTLIEKQIIFVKDNGTPVGYVFSTISDIEEKDRKHYPDWAPKYEKSIGFYPDWVSLPKKIGCLSNLYLREEYRGTGIGGQLFDMTMKWLESFSDCELTFVFISNGNEDALRFYLNHGFTLSHDVFGGFIQAAYKFKDATI